MTQERKTKISDPSAGRAGAIPATLPAAPAPEVADLADLGAGRPLSARSVIASTLLGMDPPRLPALLLVRTGEVFGISAGTTRVALSRMLNAGELMQVDGGYELTGRLLERHGRQAASRAARHRAWTGEWEQAVVVGDRREAASRSALREAMRRLKLAELREGVWMRPDNLDGSRSPASSAVVDAQCQRLTATVDDPAALAASLWDLDEWAANATRLQRAIDESLPKLERGDTSHLGSSFVLAATVLRHLLADPELPDDLLAPDWPGAALRSSYDTYEAAYQHLFRDWFRSLL